MISADFLGHSAKSRTRSAVCKTCYLSIQALNSYSKPKAVAIVQIQTFYNSS